MIKIDTKLPTLKHTSMVGTDKYIYILILEYRPERISGNTKEGAINSTGKGHRGDINTNIHGWRHSRLMTNMRIKDVGI